MCTTVNKIRKNSIIVAVVWTAVLSCSFAWYYYEANEDILENARVAARSAFEKNAKYRRWVAHLGGLYVDAGLGSSPDPFLSHLPKRNVRTVSGKELTLVSPMRMMHLVNEYAGKNEQQLRSHITSLKLLNPANPPDTWEIRALRAFVNGVPEVSEVQASEGREHMRLMLPLITEHDCLKCHVSQGHNIGDVLGGVSVTVPLDTVSSGFKTRIIGGVVTHGGIWLFGLGMIGVGSRKLSHNAHILQESEERYRTVADFTADWEYWQGLDGKFRYMSPSCVTTCGYSQDEFYGNPGLMMQVIHPDDLSNYEQHAHGTPDKICLEPLDFRIVTRSGETRWISHVSRVVYTSDGIMNGVRASNRDITERKLAEDSLHVQTIALEEEMAERQMAQEALQDQAVILEEEISERMEIEEAIRFSEKKFIKTFESAPIMMTVSTLEDGTYLDVNRKFTEMSGFSHDEAVGKTSKELGFIPNEERQRLFMQLCATGSVNDMELNLHTKDGKVLTSMYSAEIIKVDGRECLISLAHDVTKQRIVEDQLRQSQKMEAIGQLAGGVAHDFNNILTVIMGYGSLLQMDGSLDQEQREKIVQIIAASERAVQITRGLLAVSRKESMDFRNNDLNEIITHVQKFLARVIGEDILMNISCIDEKIPVMVDATHIEQVVINLVTNARDAMQKGGEINLETGVLEIDDMFAHAHGFGTPGRYGFVTVSDTGCGMDEVTCKKIFEPFFTTKGIGKGTGLGMAIVYGIIEQHNGFVTVNSVLGEGTTFRIYLPLSDTNQGEINESQTVLAPVGGSETILLAEDDPEVRGVMESFLREYGYKLILASDGQDAVEKFADNKKDIQLVLMDMIMPRKNGQEALSEIKSLRPDIKAFYVSGYTADFIKNRGVSEEAVEVITKPPHPVDFLRKVRDMLDRN
jgi:PAS domain S-box-containing protein